MVILTIGMMIAIGAIIGGVTNHLAIQMLFRPHEAKYIKGRRVPFTPGLIPKRRDELAIQMGKLVVEHLVTAEGIKRKFQEASFTEELINLAQGEAEKLFHSGQTVHDLSNKLGVQNIDDLINGKLGDALEIRVSQFVSTSLRKPIHSVIPIPLVETIEEKIPQISGYIALKGTEYFQSDEGIASLKKMIDDFLATRGMLGGMIQMFLGQGSLVEKIQPEIIKFLKNPGTKEIITRILRKEWYKIKERELGDFDFIQKEQVTSLIKGRILDELSVSSFVQKPIKEIISPFRTYIVDKAVPWFIQQVGSYLAQHADVLLKKLRVQEIVQEQVEGFPVARLEDMVLSISKKEFKMITYLGALLGGIIGLFQGILAIVLG